MRDQPVLCLIAAAGALALQTACADEAYVLADGESDTIALSDGATTNLSSVTVAGDLTITGDGWIKTPTINLNGGTITVDGTKASIGSGNSSSDTPTSFTVTNAEDGVYGKVIVKNGTTTGAVSGNRYNFAAKFFQIATNAADVTGIDGCIDVLSVSNAGVAIREFSNYSVLTARISLAGNAWFGKGGGYAYGAGIFTKGAAEVALADGAQVTFGLGNQLGSFNAEGVPVTVTGTGDVVFRQQYNVSNPDYPMSIRKGAVLNNIGKLQFRGDWGAGWITFQNGAVIGPNVTNISFTASDSMTLDVAKLATISVPDVDLVRAGISDKLVGEGTMRIDASSTPRTFRAHIPVTYIKKYSSVDHTCTNSITIEKVGGYEATISSTTNIPTLKVLEGPLRITSDCVISNLHGAAGATLIADGCDVRITGEAVLKGLALETANGGAFVMSGEGRQAAYEPGNILGRLHVATGELVFSQYGFPQKYWRWTFTKVYNGPRPVHFGRFWVFDTEGGHAAQDLAYKTPGTALTAGSCRWVFDPSTNIAIASSTSYWQGPSYVIACFRADFTSSLNNFANFSSPVVDPENPASHLALEMRLKDTALPVTGYNISTALRNDYPMSWIVEASEDGVDWIKVDEQTDLVHPVPSPEYYFFDGEAAYLGSGKAPAQIRGKPIEFFHFTDYRRDGLAALAAPLDVQVDNGASLDLRAFTSGQPINAITIDLSTGGGTIHGGVAAAGGTLVLKNAAASGRSIFAPLPLTVDGLGSAGNLGTWTVIVDGGVRKCKLALVDGALKLLPPGIRITIR